MGQYNRSYYFRSHPSYEPDMYGVSHRWLRTIGKRWCEKFSVIIIIIIIIIIRRRREVDIVKKRRGNKLKKSTCRERENYSKPNYHAEISSWWKNNVFFKWKLVPSRCYIKLPLSGVTSVEINWRHYFRSLLAFKCCIWYLLGYLILVCWPQLLTSAVDPNSWTECVKNTFVLIDLSIIFSYIWQ